MAATQLEDLSEAQLLDEIDALHERQRRTDVDVLLAVAEFARQHGAGTVDPVAAQKPGRERAVQLGGEGTPLVAEFAASVLAARLQLSAHAGAKLVADVLDLQHRLPILWAGVRTGRVRVGHARFVARRTRELTPDEAGYVDARVAESADGRLSWSRFETLIEASIVAADPETARAREEEAARRSFVKATRSTQHGMRGLYVRADFARIVRIEATVAYLAQALQMLGDGSSLDDRRVKAVLMMANPVQAVEVLRAFEERKRHLSEVPEESPEPRRFDPAVAVSPGAGVVDDDKLLPAVRLYVHLAGAGGDSVARVEGCGPVTAEWVREHLGDRTRFTITPVLDPLDQVPVDAWEVPRRHRQAVRLLTPADTFPFAASTTRATQIDHTVPYAHDGPPGQSRVGNYGPMTGFHHRIKTHGRWTVRQPFPGVYAWRDPYGATYVVDHSGTRRLATRRPAARHQRSRTTSGSRVDLRFRHELVLAS